MGYPCLRNKGNFFACVERSTGYLIVKLPAHRIAELVATGEALPFAPNGRTFREWAAFPVADGEKWCAILEELACSTMVERFAGFHPAASTSLLEGRLTKRVASTHIEISTGSVASLMCSFLMATGLDHVHDRRDRATDLAICSPIYWLRGSRSSVRVADPR